VELIGIVRRVLEKANLWQDDNTQAFNELYRHYNRGMKEDVASAKKKFKDYIAKEIRWFNHELSKVVGIRDTKAELTACMNALWCLGRVTHTWQDYYAHAVLKSNGEAGPAWGANPPISGSPDKDNENLKPSSWKNFLNRGEHGTFWDPWSEPADRDLPGGRQLRWNDAESFVFEKYKIHLPKWYEKCWCHPDK